MGNRISKITSEKECLICWDKIENKDIYIKCAICRIFYISPVFTPILFKILLKNVHIVNMKILYIHIIMKIVIFYKNNLNIYYL